jgi:predicted unusual protein kinase regulating ubiquinone biosynthesis (AarF/ABC1/UbiB family)
MEGTRVGLVDFGIVGYLSSDSQDQMLSFLAAIGRHDAGSAFAAMVRILQPGRQVDLRQFRTDHERNVRTWLQSVENPVSSRLRDKGAGRLMLENLKLLRKYGLHLPNEFLRWYRALLIADSVVFQLAPEMNPVEALKVKLTRVANDRFAKELTPDRIVTAALYYATLAVRAPDFINSLIKSRLLQDVFDLPQVLDSGLKGGMRLLKHFLAGAARFAGTALALLGITVLLARAAGARVSWAPGGPNNATQAAAVSLIAGLLLLYTSRLARR